MSRKLGAGYVNLLRELGNDHPEAGFDLGELLQGVLIAEDQSHLHRLADFATVGVRLNQLAGGAGVWSLGAVNTNGVSIKISTLKAVAAGRVCLRTDGDQISAGRTAVSPPVGVQGVTMRSACYVGTAAADPNPGSDFLSLAGGDVVSDIWIPANCSLIFTGAAANQAVTVYLFYRESRD